jgi:hypothetical protein
MLNMFVDGFVVSWVMIGVMYACGAIRQRDTGA